MARNLYATTPAQPDATTRFPSGVGRNLYGPVRESDPQRRETGMERFLDALSTTNYMSAGAVRAALAGENPLEGATSGIRDRTTYGDILREHGITGPAAAIGGFIGDVALNPLTYTGIGALTKVGKVRAAAELGLKLAELSGDATRIAEAGARLAGVGRAGAGLAGQARAGERALVTLGGRTLLPMPEMVGKGLDVVGRAGSAALEGVRVGGKLQGVDRSAFLARRASVEAAPGVATKHVTQALEPHARALMDLARAEGIDGNRAFSEIGNALEAGQKSWDPALFRGSLAKNLPGVSGEFLNEAERAATKINAMNAVALAREKGIGIPIAGLSDQMGYLFHNLRPEARDVLDKLDPDLARAISGGRDITERMGAQLPREIRDKTAQEVNALAESGQLVIGGRQLPAIPGGIFQSNPFLATTVRSAMSARSVESARMLKDWARVYGRQIAPNQLNAIPLGWKHIPSDLSELKNVYFPPDIAKELGRFDEAMKDPSPFIRMYDDYLRTWKKYTLGIFPIYHTRNEVGDLFNAVALGGMGNGLVDGGARALQRVAQSIEVLASTRGARRSADMVTLGKRGWSGTKSELRSLAEGLGVIDAGQVSEAFDRMKRLQAAPKGVMGRIAAAVDDNAATRLGVTVGNARENSTRMALFMDRLAKGDAPEAAALYTKKHLFDYGQLTHFEQKYAKRLMPFYTFTRFNVPLQLGNALEKPGVYAGMQKARREAAGNEPLGIEDARMPPFLRDALPIRAGQTSEGNPQFMRMQGYLPGSDLELLDPGQAVSRGVSMLTPALQVPAEMVSNVDLYGSDIPGGDFKKLERSPGETSNLLGLNLSRRWVQPALRAWRPISELDRLNPGGMFGNAEGGASFLPPEMSAPRRYAEPDMATRIMAGLAGRAYAVDETQQVMQQMRDTEKTLRDLEYQYQQFMARGDVQNAERIAALLERVQNDPLAGR